jgi:hypothetical protein
MGAILDHLIKDHGATMEEAKIALLGWELRPIENDGVQVGEIMLKENEVHMAMDKLERNRSGRRALLYGYINALLKERGFLVTRLFRNDKYKTKIERLGFKQTHSDGQYDYFWLNAEPAK